MINLILYGLDVFISTSFSIILIFGFFYAIYQTIKAKF